MVIFRIDQEFRRQRTIKIDIGEMIAAGDHLVADLEGIVQIPLLLGCLLVFLDSAHLRFDLIHTLADTGGILDHRFELVGIAAQREEGNVVILRIVDFEPGDADRHDDVGDCVRFREHVLDLLAGFDVPVRNVVLLHHLLVLVPGCPFLLGDLAFTDVLHDIEGSLGRHAVFDQADHDIVTAADDRLQFYDVRVD